MLSNALSSFQSLNISVLRPEGFYKKFREARIRDIDLVTNKNSWESVSLCPICNSSDIAVEFEFYEIPVSRCKKCTHRFTSLVPHNTNMIYDSAQYTETVMAFEKSQEDYRAQRFGEERAEIIAGLCNKQKGVILDVGCGWGLVLSKLKLRNYECYGIEMSEPMAAIARKEFGLNVKTTPIEEYRSDKLFDLISLFGVIEHIKSPVDAMASCARLLSQSGKILIFTPNFDSLAVWFQKSNANQIYPSQHLHHFTALSITKMAKSAGLEVLSYETKGIDIGDICAQLQAEEKTEALAFLLNISDPLQAALDEAGCANHMRVVLGKI